MVITQITACKKSKDRFNIYCDRGFVCALFFDTIAEHGIKVGKDVSEDELKRIGYKDDCLKCYQKACYLLSVRSRSTGEIVSRLKEKGYDDSVIEYVVHMLLERDYLDDVAFAREYAEYLLKKGYGDFAIRQKLYAKKVDSQIVMDALEELTLNDKMDAAFEYGKRAFVRACREEDLYKRKNKFLAAMARHGFGYDAAKQVYTKLSEEQ